MRPGSGWHSVNRLRLRPVSAGLSAFLCMAVGLLAVIARPSAAWAQMHRDVTVHGTVRTDAGTVLKGVTVRLETDAGELAASTTTSTSGEFSFIAPSSAGYVLVANGEGLETYREPVDLGEGPDTYEITVVMLPLRKTLGQKASPPALSDAAAPKEARRDYQKARRAIEAHKWGAARKALEAAVAKYSCYARAQTDLGMLLSQEKHYKASEAALHKSISCDAGYLDAYLGLGALLNAESRFSDAFTVLEQGLRQAPASWQFHYQMGVAEYGLKHYDLAEQQYLKAKSLNQDPVPELYAKLADVYLRENEFDKAYTQMQSYLSADPSGPFASRIKEIMKQMRSSGVLQEQTAKAGPPSHQC